jgi:two-component sensor histidine kinase
MGTEKLATILLVEDDIITALFERETLEARGYTVLVAKTGNEAVKLAGSTKSIDLVLMDINLGSDLDGVDAAGIITRASPLPIVFMSSHTDEATLRRLEGIDAYGYVVKGSTDAVLCTAVSMALRRAKAEKAAAKLQGAEHARNMAESELRIKEAHHRVRNNIASIRAMMSLQLGEARHPETVSALQDAIGRIEGMSSLYEMLTGESRGGDIEVGPYVDSLIATIMPLFSNASTITIEKQVDDFWLDPKRMFALGIIINELLTNVMKYAFSGKDQGLVRLNITAYDETVILTLRDDGNGLPGDFELERSSGLGLSLIKMLLEQFNGTLAMRSDRGTTSTVLIHAPGLATTRSTGIGQSEIATKQSAVA